MNMSFYTAAVGAEQQQRRIDVHGNNIANINTDGFKARRPSFKALMNDYVLGAQRNDLPRGTGSYMIGADVSLKGSPTPETGRPLDYAISGEGYFALWDPETNEYSYSRDGSFTISEFYREVPVAPEEGGGDDQPTTELQAGWFLADGLGRFVLSNEGRMIEVTDQNADLPIGIFDFLNINGSISAGDNRLLPIDKNGELQFGSGKLLKGHLQKSNADLATEFVKVIETQHAFTYALKMVQTSDEIETTVNGLR